MKKNALMVVIIMILLVSGCQQKTEIALEKDNNADKGLAVWGDNVKFDPNIVLNNGEPIEMEYWIWGDYNMFDGIATQFEDIYPNVSIKIVEHPWTDMWTKLPLALQNGNGPTLFNVHNSQHDVLIKYMEAYDIPLDALRKDFQGVDAHVIDDKVYYIDFGKMNGSIFYNKQLWTDAGLTEEDIPKTWDEFIEIGKKLTKLDAEGNITQAGFTYNDDVTPLLIDMNYQKGHLLFDESGSKSTYNSAVSKENLQLLMDMYDIHKIGDKDFGTTSSDSFIQGHQVMTYKWGWFNNMLVHDYPELEYGVFALPTFSEETIINGRYNGESTIGINNKASNAEKEVAQAFLKFYLANDEALKELCLKYSVFPTKLSLQDDKDINTHPVLVVTEPISDKLIWPGPFPAAVENELKTASEEIIYNGVDMEKALLAADTKVTEQLGEVGFIGVENMYKYYEELMK